MSMYKYVCACLQGSESFAWNLPLLPMRVVVAMAAGVAVFISALHSSCVEVGGWLCYVMGNMCVCCVCDEDESCVWNTVFCALLLKSGRFLLLRFFIFPKCPTPPSKLLLYVYSLLVEGKMCH